MSQARLHRIGWLLFLLSSIGFLVSSLRARDLAAVGGSVAFLLGVVAFLIPPADDR